MKGEIFQSNQAILQGDLARAQSSKEEAIKSRLLDIFVPGIVAGSQQLAEALPFNLTLSVSPYAVTVGTGIAYDPQGERIIINSLSTYNSSNLTTATNNGIGGTTVTPQSTGNQLVPLTTGRVNYIYVSYVKTTDPTVFTLQQITGERLFTKADDGYRIDVVTDIGPAIGNPITFRPSANAIFLGVVDTVGVLSTLNRIGFSLGSQNITGIVPTTAQTLLAKGLPYMAGQAVSLDTHVHAVGTGTVTPQNPHGLSVNDLVGNFSGKTSEQHEKLFHESGISGNSSSTNSALYGTVTFASGAPIPPTYARDNFLLKKLLPSTVSQTFTGNGSNTSFTLTGGLTYIPGGLGLKVYINGILQSFGTQYTEVSNNAVNFTVAPASGTTVLLTVLQAGEAVQINGTTISSTQVTEDELFYFVDASGNFLDPGLYTIYLDAASGTLKLAASVSPVNTGYRVFGVTSGTFVNANVTALSTVTANPNNFLLWRVNWSGTSPGPGNFSGVTDLRIFGTVGSGSLARDSGTNTVTLTHNLTAQNIAATGGVTAAGVISSTSGNGFYLVPSGTILSYAGSSAPSGWVECDGRSLTTAAYPSLFSSIGYNWGGSGANFNIPDLRGMFLRGRPNKSSQTFLPAAVNTGTFVINIPNHGFNRSGFMVSVSSTGTLPSPLTATSYSAFGNGATISPQPMVNTPYFVIIVDSNNIQLASSHANALVGTPVAITTQGTGTHTIYQAVDPDSASREASAPGGSSGDSVGSYEEQMLVAHNHVGWGGSNGGDSGLGGSFLGATYGSSSGGNENRPRNVYVMYMIKT